MNDLPIFDKEAVMERLDNDLDLLSELLLMLFDDAEARIADIKAAGAVGNNAEVEKRAHSIKSAFGNLGALKAHKAAHNIELAGRNNNLPDIEKMVDGLMTEFLTFKTAVSSYLK